VLGINPILGREFTTEEDRAGGPAVTVLSYALWRQAFQADPSVIGRAATLRGEAYTIVGVMPQGFQTAARADLWTPLRPSTTGEGEGTNYAIIARLKGVTWVQADSQIGVIGAAAIQQRRLRPEVSARLFLVPLQRGLTNGLRKPLLLVWAAVGLVLFIGCVNIAGLQLARSASRTREIATRLALGSGRAAVIWQLLA
jgi:MacB-like periplasmic core domain